MTLRRISRITLLSLALIAAACGGGSKTDAPGATVTSGAASKPSGGAGSLIIAEPAGLTEYNIKGGSTKTLVAAGTPGTFLLDPAISPDGRRLAYIMQPPPMAENNTYDAGSDVWVANRDGSGARAIYQHAQANQLVRFPQWEDDSTVLAVVQEIATANGQTNVVYTLERIDVDTGERTKVKEDVLAFGLAPDRKRIAYAKMAPQTGETLVLAELAGGAEMTLAGIEQKLAPFNSPRFSPDGTKVAFASAGQPGARAPAEYVSYVPQGRSPSVDAARALDGVPEDIWTVGVAGGAPVRVGDLKEDLPAEDWSGDGKHIYVVGSAGLYDIVVGTGAVDRLGDGALHGQIVWVP